MQVAHQATFFQTHRGSTVRLHPIREMPEKTFPFSPIYQQPTEQSTLETFDFLFETFKKGIYLQICMGRLRLFLPFENDTYVNTWHYRLDLESVPLTRKVQPHKHWYANNYLVRFENPFAQTATGYAALEHLFRTLCQTHSLPNIECFVNRRDFPLLTENGSHPYEAISQEALPNKPTRPLLLLSMVGRQGFADVPIPTPDDWERATGQSFSQTHRARHSAFSDTFSSNWRAKKNQVVFRGSNTGAHFGEQRIRACELCAPDARCDVRLTSLSTRHQIIDGKLCAPNVRARATPLIGDFLTLEQQSQYRYILHIPGHVQSFRLGAELATYSTLLCVESSTYLWFEPQLVPWRHYVPVAADLSNLIERLDWCQAHETECEQMAHEARRFYERTLSQQGCLEYLARILWSYRQQCAPFGYLPIRCLTNARLEEHEQHALWQHRPPRNAPTPVSTHRSFLSLIHAPTRLQTTTLHEATLRLRCVNELLEEIPNFVYTAGFEPPDQLSAENLPPCRTLSEYIQSANFRFSTFVFILKQLTLSLAYAQSRHLFLHGQATPDHILLLPARTHLFDYSTSEGEIWRVATEGHIPLWAQFAHSAALSDDAFLAPKANTHFYPFLDCLWLLAQCVARIVRYHPKCEPQLKHLLDTVFASTDGVFYAPDEPLVSFLARVSDPDDLERVPKGNALHLHPMTLFRALPADARIQQVAGVQYTHFGRTNAPFHAPNHACALVRRYFQQRGARATTTPILEDPAPNITHHWHLRWADTLEMRHWRFLNMVQSVLADGSAFALQPDEKQQLLAKVRPALARYHTLWGAAKDNAINK